MEKPQTMNSFYPGDDLVDLIGLDFFFDLPNWIKAQNALNVLERMTDKPFVFTEFGPVASIRLQQSPQDLGFHPRGQGS